MQAAAHVTEWGAQRHAFNREEVRDWSAREGMAEKFEEFVAALEG